MGYRPIRLDVGDLFTTIIRGGSHSKNFNGTQCAGKPGYGGRTFIAKKVTPVMVCAGDQDQDGVKRKGQFEYQFTRADFNFVKVKDSEITP